MANNITVAALPNISETALTLLQWMYAGTGVITDTNVGGIARTFSEAIGSVQEEEGIIAQAQAFQALIYSAYNAFGISPLLATSSVGSVTISTLSGSPIPANVSVYIPAGTLFQTSDGVQFVSTAASTLFSGTTNVSNIPIQSVSTGSDTNVSSGTINQISTGLAYPLAVTNPLPTTGGEDAEGASETLARFTAFVDSLGLCSPLAVVSSVIGVSYEQEIVYYASCFEPWITAVLNQQTPSSGYQIFIDDSSGSASSNLVTAVTNFLTSGGTVGYRPAGVPFWVYSGSGVPATVVVTATSVNSNNAAALQTAITQAIQTYFASLNFGDTAESTQMVANIANVSFGQLSSLSVTLENATYQSVSTIASSYSGRVILQGYSVTVS